MIANYGYADAEGTFYITIDTARCEGCAGKPCLAACPRGVLSVEETPYGDEVAAVADAARKRLRDICSACKPAGEKPPLPCVVACPLGALTHSW